MRYVSGPLLKNTCGLKYREDMAENDDVSYSDVEQPPAEEYSP